MADHASSAPAWLTDPELAGLWARVRDRLERNGLVPMGRIRVELTGRPERHATSALLGRSVTRGSVLIDLAELDARLAERSGLGGLLDVIVLVGGGQLRDRPSERRAKADNREAPLMLARRLVDRPWSDAWVADLRRTGLLTRAANAEEIVHAAAAVVAQLEGRAEGPPRSRVELAAQVLGDAHALDEDRLLHRVVLRALAAAANVLVPESPAERRSLWESAGVAPDGVSSTCLILGLRAWAGGSLGARLAAASEAGDPMHLTGWDLRRLQKGGLAANGPVLVCENPRVLEAVAERWGGRTAVVCTAGEPNTVVVAVLADLAARGTELRYHGDFDWPGISMAQRAIARFGVVPWLMGAADYEANVRAEAPRLAGAPVEPSWDPELGATMRAHDRCLHEETMLPELLSATYC